MQPQKHPLKANFLTNTLM